MKIEVSNLMIIIFDAAAGDGEENEDLKKFISKAL